jgi:acyl-CoA dehydrogenase
MISFGLTDDIRERIEFVRGVAVTLMRPAAREFDEREHQIPWEFVNAMWDVTLKTGQSFRSGTRRETGGTAAQSLVHVIETLSWGDAGIYLCGPAPAWAAPPSKPPAPRSRSSASSRATARALRSGPAWP